MSPGSAGPDTRAMTLLLQLLELDPKDRDPFLDDACAEVPDLRVRVESLRARLDESAAGGRTADLQNAFLPAEGFAFSGAALLEDFEIIDQIGEGGMGVVYRARQLRPVEREVAVKVLRRHAGEQLLSRFETEWKTLAQMEHPSIARLLDVRSDTDGSPCFVMELVRGDPLIAYCEKNALDLRDRLDILYDVCLGVQHAHEKGVLHRDLKPDNILVASVDGRHVSKIIDFGIARALEVAAGPSPTLTGQLLGTPEYMSPEQALGRQLDTRSDIYSLGVILYRCLTGESPYDLGQGSVLDIIRIVAEEQVRRPTQVSESGRKLDRDLEMIVLKSLEKEPERRYHSAASLGGDLQRYLASEPVLARPSSTLYHLLKLVSRHRAPFALAATLFVISIASTILVTILYQKQKVEQEAATRSSVATERSNTFLVDVISGAAADRSIEELTVAEALLAAEKRIRDEPLEDPTTQALVLMQASQVHQGLGAQDVTRSLRLEASLLAIRAIEEARPASRDVIIPVRGLLDETFQPSLDEPPVTTGLVEFGITNDIHANVDFLGSALLMVAQADALAGHSLTANVFNREGITLLNETNPEAVPQGAGYLQIFLSTDIDRFKEAESIALAYLEQFPDVVSQGYYGYALAKTMLHQERNEEALHFARLGVAGVQDTGGTNFSLARLHLVRALFRNRSFAEADTWLEETLESTRSLSIMGKQTASVQSTRVHLELARGAIEAAVAAAEETKEHSEDSGSTGLLLLALCRNVQGRFAESETLCREILAMETEESKWRPTKQGHSRFGLAWSLYGQEKYAEARGRLEEVIELWERSHVSPPYWWLDLARLLLAACGAPDGGEAASPRMVDGWKACVLELGRAPYIELAEDAHRKITTES